jgi:MFS superfamily sulfate permease-like transporter
MKKKSVPSDGLHGLRQNFKSDMLSGFLVFLIALPLSLGIAAASDFPPLYGLITAMIGGLVVSFFAGSHLTIKGPAAGLIVIVAGAVAEFGNGNNVLGWKLALGAIVVAGAVQIIFGLLKFGSFSDFFPISAVHGMLAAIGIIIISKQAHVLVGMNPLTHEGRPMVEPLELLLELKNTIANITAHVDVLIVGGASLFIVFAWPKIPVKLLRKIPAALVVLLVAIPLAKLLGLHNTPDVRDSMGALVLKGYSPMLTFDRNLFELLGVQVDFGGFHLPALFIKYVAMFAIVGSIEALLTVKAIDVQDPYKRRSNPDKDLVAVGIGNMVTGVLGGLPMISEVARSSANVANGAKTRWANFFHGLFIFIFLCFEVSFDDLIPKAALAAMLIGVGWKLAHPRAFGHMAKIGKDQIVIFITTIVVTLATDLLLGIAAGIMLKFIMHLARGVTFGVLFKAKMSVSGTTVIIEEAAIFSNFISIKKQLLSYDLTSRVTIDFQKCNFIDHSVIEILHHIKDDFKVAGGELLILGIEELNPVGNSKHPLAAQRRKM